MDRKRLKGVFNIIIFFSIASIFLFVFIFLLWTSNPIKSLNEVNNYLISNEEVNVKIKENKDIFFLKNHKSEKYLIFYPGGNIDYLAYSPLCFKLAQKGINVILLKMPFNLALFGINKANLYLKNFKKCFLCGHSLGGVAATIYAKNNFKKVKGVILLASYPSVDISKSQLNILSIYASNDGLAIKEKIDNKKRKYYGNI